MDLNDSAETALFNALNAVLWRIEVSADEGRPGKYVRDSREFVKAKRLIEDVERIRDANGYIVGDLVDTRGAPK